MSNVFVDLTATAANIGYSLLVDGLGMATRPLVLLHQADAQQFASLAMFRDGGIVVGIIGTVSVAASAASLAALCRCSEAPLRLGGLVSGLGYMADALSQLPKILLPFAPAAAAVSEVEAMAAYPTSRTGLVTLMLQMPMAACFIASNPMYPPMPNYLFLSAGLSMRFMSATLAAPGGASSRLLYATSLPVMAFGLVPPVVLEQIGKALQVGAKVAWEAFQVVYTTVQRVLPKVRASKRTFWCSSGREPRYSRRPPSRRSSRDSKSRTTLPFRKHQSDRASLWPTCRREVETFIGDHPVGPRQTVPRGVHTPTNYFSRTSFCP